MIDDSLVGSKEPSQPISRSHFTFERYTPNSVSESGVPMLDRVSIQFSGDELSATDVIAKFEDFLKASGYSLGKNKLDLI